MVEIVDMGGNDVPLTETHVKSEEGIMRLVHIFPGYQYTKLYKPAMRVFVKVFVEQSMNFADALAEHNISEEDFYDSVGYGEVRPFRAIWSAYRNYEDPDALESPSFESDSKLRKRIRECATMYDLCMLYGRTNTQ
jgi:hypothetical protein